MEMVQWKGKLPSGEDVSCPVHQWSIEARDITDITAYSDSDWAGDAGTRKSMLSIALIAAGAAITCKARRSKLICTSSCEAEVDAAVWAMKEAKYLVGMQRQFRQPPAQWGAASLPSEISLRIDNQAALTAMTSQQRGRNRHFDIRQQFLRYELKVSDFVLSYIGSADNPADGGTKPLDRQAQLTSARRLLGSTADLEL